MILQNFIDAFFRSYQKADYLFHSVPWSVKLIKQRYVRRPQIIFTMFRHLMSNRLLMYDKTSLLIPQVR